MIPIFDKPSENDYDIPQNMYWTNDTGNGRPGYVKTHGLSTRVASLPTTAGTTSDTVRGMVEYNNRVYYAGLKSLYWYNAASEVGSSTAFLYGIDYERVFMVAHDNYVVAVEPYYGATGYAGGGGGIKYYNVNTSAAGTALATSFFQGICYQDGYFIAWNMYNDKFYISSLKDPTTWSLLDFEGAEYRDDKIVVIESLGENLYVFGTRTLEVYYNSGNSDFPFVRLEGGVFDYGCKAAFSLINVNGVLYFLANDLTVVRLNGFSPERVSTAFVEKKWTKYLTVENAYAWTYSYGGESFYVLTFPTADDAGPLNNAYRYGKTFVLNVNTGVWHSWIDTTGTTDTQFPVTHCVQIQQYKIVGGEDQIIYVGCRGGAYVNTSPGLYTLVKKWDHSVFKLPNALATQIARKIYTINGTSSVECCIYTPIIEAKRERMFFNEFELYAKEDVGATDVSPSLTLSWSDDRGTNFSTGRTLSLGTATGGSKVITAHRLGTSYDRIFRLKSDHRYDNVIYGGYLR